MRYFYLAIGFVAFGLGIVGAFLPVLPTAPFLLVASFGFAKGSEKFDRWFKSTKLYKNNLESFEKNRSMRMKTKVKILAFATIMLSIVFFKYEILPMRIMIAVLLLLKYYYFLRVVKTTQ